MRSDKVIAEDVLVQAKSLVLKKERAAIKLNSLSAVALCCAFIITAMVLPQAAVMPNAQHWKC